MTVVCQIFRPLQFNVGIMYKNATVTTDCSLAVVLNTGQYKQFFIYLD